FQNGQPVPCNIPASIAVVGQPLQRCESPMADCLGQASTRAWGPGTPADRAAVSTLESIQKYVARRALEVLPCRAAPWPRTDACTAGSLPRETRLRGTSRRAPGGGCTTRCKVGHSSL